MQKMYVQRRGLPVFSNVDKRFHIGYSYSASFKEVSRVDLWSLFKI